MKQTIVDNSSGVTGSLGIIIGKISPGTPSEWLIFLSTGLVLCQMIHWVWRFVMWRRVKK